VCSIEYRYNLGELCFGRRAERRKRRCIARKMKQGLFLHGLLLNRCRKLKTTKMAGASKCLDSRRFTNLDRVTSCRYGTG
jgi:hypothetical protein